MGFDSVSELLNYLPWLAAGVVMWLVARAASRGAARSRVPAYLCSGCFHGFPAASTHLIPWFNAHEDNYVTTFRCEKCWLPSLAQTHDRLSAATDGEADRRKLVAFFERYGISGLSHEDVTGLLAILDDLKAGRRVLPLPIAQKPRPGR